LCERYFRGLCVGPCASRVSPEDYADRLAKRDVLLLGQDEQAVRRLEQELDSGAIDSVREREALRMARTLRLAFDRLAVLRSAEPLLEALLILPGAGEGRTIATVSPAGLHLAELEPRTASAERVLAWHRRRTSVLRSGVAGRLARPVADGLCVAARHLRAEARMYAWVPHAGARPLGPSELLRRAFGAD
jgi:hypothetical protein